ncbi:MAG: DUF4153 domain-containing protein, partial [Bacteroidota bacterium]
IAYHGLAYKRIGVFFFLLATVLGLLTLFHKIRNQRSLYYLFRVNGWAVYGTMILLCLFNWDMIIARHNLMQEYPGDLDTEFLLTLSDKTLPILLEHHDLALAKVQGQVGESMRAESAQTILNDYEAGIKQKIRAFREAVDTQNWPSWTWQNAQTEQYLKQYHGSLNP